MSVLSSPVAPPADPAPFAAPALNFFADLSVQVDAPQEVGATVHGRRRLIPIVGGEVSGQGWRGRVRAGGADFQLIVNDRLAELDARYTIETDGGDLIFVSNRAVRVAAPDVMARLMKGEAVDPALVYFRCTPQFETACASLAWISERLFIGTGVRQPDRVLMRFFEVA